MSCDTHLIYVFGVCGLLFNWYLGLVIAGISIGFVVVALYFTFFGKLSDFERRYKMIMTINTIEQVEEFVRDKGNYEVAEWKKFGDDFL